VAGAGISVKSRRPWGLALTLPWLIACRGVVRGDVWPPARWWRIPVKYALMGEQHLLAIIALLVSSARHRAPVL
jgi:hypothetical protein